MNVTRIGLDLAKNVFEVHGVDAEEQLVVRRTLRRGKVLEYFAQLPPCVVGMEACGGAHYWADRLAILARSDGTGRLSRNPGDLPAP
jgi:transposase